MGNIKKCPECKKYTLETVCPSCSGETADPGPPAYSPDDAYGDERRTMKQETRED